MHAMDEPVWQRIGTPPDPLGRLLFHSARVLALAGGFLLLGLTVMSVGSIVGRWLFGRPVLGDFELIQMGCAVAVSAFLPWCQARRHHVIVDFLTQQLSPRAKSALDALGGLLLALAAGVITWRMALGMVELRTTRETSMLLGVPTWLAYAGMLPSFALLALVALHSTWTEAARSVKR